MEALDLDSLLDDLTPEDEFSSIIDGDTLVLSPKVKEDDGTRKYQHLSYFDLIPKEGLHLGLDISKNSTGLTLIHNGVYKSWNHSLAEEEGVHSETLKRRQLYRYFLSEFGGEHFDTILIEDAYSGKNPETVRLLYAINTAIDELILDGHITCSNFIRANNQSWKSWLWSIEPQIGKGLDDKVRTELLLEYLGVKEEGEGYQDRLDSLGLLLGYFYKHYINEEDLSPVPKILWSQVQYTVVEDLTTLAEVPAPYSSLPVVEVDTGTKEITKEYIKYLIATNVDSLVVIRSNRSMAITYELLGIPRGCNGLLVLWRK